VEGGGAAWAGAVALTPKRKEEFALERRRPTMKK
jgi:hypothetical protein